MSALPLPEYWLRGPVEEVPALLQPVIHALLQARDEVNRALNDFPEDKLWKKPAGVASVAFHLQHIAGVIDRLLTYARGAALSQEQLTYLSEEGIQKDSISVTSLLQHLDKQVDNALTQIKQTNITQLTAARTVGRKKMPTTLIGLLFHAAEHTMRHNGQLLVTVAILKNAASIEE